jgi:E3 ubiquitin-protein ligase SHPRH
MGRGTTARRGRAFGEFGRRGIFLPRVSSSSSTPQNGENSSSSSSDIGSSPSLLDVRELPDRLIQFVSENGALPEPPRKRRKLAENGSAGGEPEPEHIVVKQSVWDIKCAGSQLYQLEIPIERRDIRPYVHWNSRLGPEYIEIIDDTKSSVFHVRLPPRDQHFEDIYLALLVDQESTKRTKLQGKLWTEFGISLLLKDGFDFIRITFTIRWNTTISPYHVPQASNKSQALSKVLNRYFSDGKHDQVLNFTIPFHHRLLMLAVDSQERRSTSPNVVWESWISIPKNLSPGVEKFHYENNIWRCKSTAKIVMKSKHCLL